MKKVSVPDFTLVFQEKQKLFTPRFGDIILTYHEIGNIVLTSGKVVACDPFIDLEADPFTANLAPGCYPVVLSVAHIQKNNDRRVAYAMLRLSERTPIRWEMATRHGEDLSSLKEGERFVYGVDTGTGCFVDADTVQIITDKWETETGEEEFADQLEEALEKNYSPTWDWAVLTVDNSTNANIIAFKSGWGDGFYASYFGYDAEDNIVNLITDFDLFERQLPGNFSLRDI